MPSRWWSCDPNRTDWCPLERFVAEPIVVAARVDPSEFMWMGEMVAGGGQVVHLYKHRRTRQYVRLDGVGVAYDDVDGVLKPHTSVLEAVAALGWFR